MDKLILFLIILLTIISILIFTNEIKYSKTQESFKVLDLNKSDKEITLHDVFIFLGDIGIPYEINMAYATTIKAKDKRKQKKLDDFLKKLKDKKLIITRKNIKDIEEHLKIELEKIGLVNSLNTLLAHVHGLRLYDEYDKFNYQVLYGKK